MVNDFFKQYELTNNRNFIGNINTSKTVYTVHVRGKKEVIVRLINDIVNVPLNDQITIADDEPRIVSAINQFNTLIKSIPHIEVPETLEENNVHLDRYREVDDNCLLSFYVGEATRSKWGLLVEHYPDTEWIIDEYRENWYLDESSVEYKFRHSYIYQNTGQIPLKTTYSTNQMDFLMEKYPVHFGFIKLEQLNREAEKKISTCTNYENKVSGDKLKQVHPNFQNTLLSIYLLTQRDLFKIRYEIDFIKDMWSKLNENVYGYDDYDLSMRFRGIDAFSPTSDINLAFVGDK